MNKVSVHICTYATLRLTVVTGFEAFAFSKYGKHVKVFGSVRYVLKINARNNLVMIIK